MKKLTIALIALLVVVMAVPAVTAQEIDLTRVRVAHFSPDTPAVEVYVNGELSGIQTLSFGNVSGWVELPAGTYEIAVAPAGTSIESAAIGPVSINLPANGWTTIAAIGSLGNGTLTASVFNESYGRLAADEANVTVFHGIEDAPAVDVILDDGTVLISSLAFGDYANITVPAGTYNLQVVPAGATSPVVINLAGTALSGQTFYFVAATNALAAPQVALSVVGFGAVESLIGKTAPTQSIADIVIGSSDFDILEAAVVAAGLATTLDEGGPFTVFAPTDAAFENLLAALDISAEDLLANTDLLTTVLQYHVLQGRAYASAVVQESSLNMLFGSVSVEVREDGVYLNGNVKILITDIEATNGVIHVIDTVLIP